MVCPVCNFMLSTSRDKSRQDMDMQGAMCKVPPPAVATTFLDFQSRVVVVIKGGWVSASASENESD